jgi:hypothetical protein
LKIQSSGPPLHIIRSRFLASFRDCHMFQLLRKHFQLVFSKERKPRNIYRVAMKRNGKIHILL